METYQEGQPVRLEADFFAAGSLEDPTAVELIVWSSGTDVELDLSTSDVSNDSTGKWSHQFTPASTGPYTYQWAGTGTVIGFASGKFSVEAKRDA